MKSSKNEEPAMTLQTKYASDIRKEKALRRLGTSNPRCCNCSEGDPRCLEEHHIAGCKYDPTTCIVCRNCHRKLSDAQRDHPHAIEDGGGFLEKIAHFLLGLADLLGLAAEKLREFAKRLIDEARARCANAQ
jgi:hypothetical protein